MLPLAAFAGGFVGALWLTLTLHLRRERLRDGLHNSWLELELEIASHPHAKSIRRSACYRETHEIVLDAIEVGTQNAKRVALESMHTLRRRVDWDLVPETWFEQEAA